MNITEIEIASLVGVAQVDKNNLHQKILTLLDDKGRLIYVIDSSNIVKHGKKYKVSISLVHEYDEENNVILEQVCSE